MKEETPTATYTGIVYDNGVVLKEMTVHAPDRKEAVQQMLKMFSKEGLKDAKKNLVVPDPFDEVFFFEDMNCHDALFNYLPSEVAQRVVSESRGVIGHDPEFPNSRCRLTRLVKKIRPSSTKKKTAPSIQLVAAKKKEPPPNPWLQSKILKTEVPKKPTYVWKDEINSSSRDGAKALPLPINEMY
ncbi:MAG: hypothetical protein FGM57_02580 [Candidatus Taylorbacteria bacterium]|nr:hypothetical protein [Candidatus Taylorbacteria bacterium]